MTSTLPPPTLPPSTPAPPQARGRLDGIDLARGLAIIGMVSVHVAPPLAGKGGWYGLPYGRASTLFALVAGLGITLASRRGPVGVHVSRLVWRALWLAPVGIALGWLGTPVAVILQYYAMWFLLAAPVVRASTRLLVWITAVGIIVGPTILVWAEITHPEWYVAGRGVWFGELGDVLLTGYYPTVSWFWLVTLGMLLARLDLASRRTAAALTVAGIAIAIAVYRGAAALSAAVDLGRWRGVLVTVGHSDSPAEQLAVAGVAIAVLGACLLAASVARPVLLPGIALGRLALTVYVGHIIVYGFAREALYSTTVDEGATATIMVCTISALLATAWLQVLPRGPLEALDRAGHQRLILPLVRAMGLAPPVSPPPPLGSAERR